MKKLFVWIVFILISSALWAQNDVSLVVSGEGKNKDEATFNALRSAIEQTCGTFISANTTILNDKLVADEVVSLSSGNIESYEYIGETTLPNGNVYVTVKTTVSVDKLTTFCESKGMTAELKGAAFAMNIKKMEFDKLAEEKAVENLCKQLKTMLPTLFDYKIVTEDPRLANSYEDVRKKHPEIFNITSEQLYEVPFTVTAVPNENFTTFFKILFNTLFEISLTAEKVTYYSKINQPVFGITLSDFSKWSLDRYYNRPDFLYFLASLDDFNRVSREECFTRRIVRDKIPLHELPHSQKYISHLTKDEKHIYDYYDNYIKIYFRSQKTIVNLRLLKIFWGLNIFRDVFVNDNFSTTNCTGISILSTPEKEILDDAQYNWCKDFIPISLFSGHWRLYFDYKSGNYQEKKGYSSCYDYDYYYWTKGVAEMNEIESDPDESFFYKESFSFKGSLFYTLEELSKISSITVHRVEKAAKEGEGSNQIQEEGEQINKNKPQIQEIPSYKLYSDTLQQAVNSYNTLLKKYPYNYQENKLSYTLPKELSQQENLLKDTLHVLLETINTKTVQLKERYKKDSTEFAQQNSQFHSKLAAVNEELLAYPYNLEKRIITDSLPMNLFGKSKELAEEMQTKIRAWQGKQEQIEQETRAAVRASNPQKFVSIFFSQAADKKNEADNLYIECRCKYPERIVFDLAYIDNRLEECNCRQLEYEKVKVLFHSREEFDRSYNQPEADFNWEISDRKKMMSAKRTIEEILLNNKQMNLKKAKASSKEDVQDLVQKIDYQKGKYYYTDVINLVFERNDKLSKEWAKNGIYFQSKEDMYEAYIEEDYDKVLKRRKNE